jgi:hypothetical protein
MQYCRALNESGRKHEAGLPQDSFVRSLLGAEQPDWVGEDGHRAEKRAATFRLCGWAAPSRSGGRTHNDSRLSGLGGPEREVDAPTEWRYHGHAVAYRADLRYPGTVGVALGQSCVRAVTRT